MREQSEKVLCSFALALWSPRVGPLTVPVAFGKGVVVNTSGRLSPCSATGSTITT